MKKQYKNVHDIIDIVVRDAVDEGLLDYTMKTGEHSNRHRYVENGQMDSKDFLDRLVKAGVDPDSLNVSEITGRFYHVDLADKLCATVQQGYVPETGNVVQCGFREIPLDTILQSYNYELREYPGEVIVSLMDLFPDDFLDLFKKQTGVTETTVVKYGWRFVFDWTRPNPEFTSITKVEK